MANTNEIYPKNFDDNNSFKVNTLSALLSGVKTKINTSLIPITCIIQILRQVSLIYKHTHTAIKEEKAHIKKHYFYKYCPPKDPKRHHSLTVGLQGHLKKYNIEQNSAENQERTTVKDQGEISLLKLYQKLLAKGEVQGLKDKVLKRIVH